MGLEMDVKPVTILVPMIQIVAVQEFVVELTELKHVKNQQNQLHRFLQVYQMQLLHRIPLQVHQLFLQHRQRLLVSVAPLITKIAVLILIVMRMRSAAIAAMVYGSKTLHRLAKHYGSSVVLPLTAVGQLHVLATVIIPSVNLNPVQLHQ